MLVALRRYKKINRYFVILDLKSGYQQTVIELLLSLTLIQNMWLYFYGLD